MATSQSACIANFICHNRDITQGEKGGEGGRERGGGGEERERGRKKNVLLLEPSLQERFNMHMAGYGVSGRPCCLNIRV
jgi:hypothetical protein